MDTFEIVILNPKAKKLLENLASLKLIRIVSKKEKKDEFKALLKKFRNTKGKTLSIEDITKEVEIVRKKRYNEKK